jgi:hypothetical protein
MKWSLVILAIVPALMAHGRDASALSLPAQRFAIGLYGGYDHPTGQADARGGVAAGVRLRWGVLRNVEVEPSLGIVRHGDASTGSGATIPAPSLAQANLNGLWRTRLWRVPVYLTAGVGLSRLDLHTGADADHDFTFNLGAGLEHELGPVRLDLSPRYHVIRTAAGASRKHLSATLGVTYAFR